MTAVPIGLGWALALVAFLTVAVIAVELVRGWLLAGRILAEPSPPSDDFAFGGAHRDGRPARAA